MLEHERHHFQIFESILRSRGIRHCHGLALWAFGGTVLGIVTALAGERAIWVCTAAIERTVNAHLDEQVRFLALTDQEVLEAVQSIRHDEQAHEALAIENSGESTGLYGAIDYLIRSASALAIWLSTKL